MSADAWGHVLDQFFDLHTRRARLRLENIVTIDGYHDEMYDWIQNTLRNWNDVESIDFDSWKFKDKKTAEKFITLFNLTWAR
jgi:hypothetical protein